MALLISDQAWWHTSKHVQNLLKASTRLDALLLTRRFSKTNPMENLGRGIKQQVVACLERNLGAPLTSCQQCFENLSLPRPPHGWNRL
jgi:hypothetical protein